MVAVLEVLTRFWLKLAKRLHYLASDLTDTLSRVRHEFSGPLSKFPGILIDTKSMNFSQRKHCGPHKA